MRRRSGYTLLEVLIVLAVLAILLALGFSTYRKARWRAEVNDALIALASTLRDARSAAQRFNVSMKVRFTSDRKYLLEAKTGSSASVRSYSREVPSDLELRYSKDGTTWKPPAGKEIAYSAPFGETGATGTLFRIRHVRDPSLEACLRIVGVTGKVVVARACP